MSSPGHIPAWLAPFLSVLGLYVSGDLGGYTIYTTKKGRVVVYPEAPANKPPTYLQQQQRARFRAAQARWQELSATQKSLWERATKKLSVDLTGQNAFISLALVPSSIAFNRMNAAVQGQLTEPTAIPG